jgi:hypothetical protein
MAEQAFPLLAPCTVGRALPELRARRARPQSTVQCPWPKRLRDKVLRSLRTLEESASDEEPVVSVDDVDLHLNPKVGLDWMNRGTQRELPTRARTRSTTWPVPWIAARNCSGLSKGQIRTAAYFVAF